METIKNVCDLIMFYAEDIVFRFLIFLMHNTRNYKIWNFHLQNVKRWMRHMEKHWGIRSEEES
jgi:hypothetical protein